MILQLLFLLDVSFDKYVAFEIMALMIEKNPSKLNKKLKKKPYIQLVKKPSKLDKKARKKTVRGF